MIQRKVAGAEALAKSSEWLQRFWAEWEPLGCRITVNVVTVDGEEQLFFASEFLPDYWVKVARVAPRPREREEFKVWTRWPRDWVQVKSVSEAAQQVYKYLRAEALQHIEKITLHVFGSRPTRFLEPEGG